MYETRGGGGMSPKIGLNVWNIGGGYVPKFWESDMNSTCDRAKILTTKKSIHMPHVKKMTW